MARTCASKSVWGVKAKRGRHVAPAVKWKQVTNRDKEERGRGRIRKRSVAQSVFFSPRLYVSKATTMMPCKAGGCLVCPLWGAEIRRMDESGRLEAGYELSDWMGEVESTDELVGVKPKQCVKEYTCAPGPTEVLLQDLRILKYTVGISDRFLILSTFGTWQQP